MTAETGPKEQLLPVLEILEYRILETPTSVRIIFPTTAVQNAILSQGFASSVFWQELCDQTALANPSKQKIEELRAAFLASETIQGLKNTREIILAPWPLKECTVVKTPLYSMSLNDYGIRVFLQILFPGPDKVPILEKALKTFEENRRVILSSAF